MANRSGGFFVVELVQPASRDELVAQVLLQAASGSQLVAEVARFGREMHITVFPAAGNGEWSFPVEEFLWAVEAARSRLASRLCT